MSEQSQLQALTAEERELILDLTQLALDIAGIIEPTPVCDLTNAAISLIRKDWVGAALSVVGAAVPYVGDLAKAGKIPGYVLKVNRAIELAKNNAKFQAVLHPILARILYVLDRIPTEQFRRQMPNAFSRELMQKIQVSIEAMRDKITKNLPAGARVMGRMDDLSERLLLKMFGSTTNVGAIPRRNVRVAAEFFDKYKVGYFEGAPDINAWANKLRGIDLHASDAIYVDKMTAHQQVSQYVQLSSAPGKGTRPIAELNLTEQQLKNLPPGTQYYTIGEWLIDTTNRVTDRNLGISGASRVRANFKVRGEVEVLRSKAAGIADSWTPGATTSAGSVLYREGANATGSQLIRKEAELVSGGGAQIFLPQAYNQLIPFNPRRAGR